MATKLTEKNQEYIPSAWETVPCLFCGCEKNSVLEKFGPKYRYRYVSCQECGLAFLNPRPRYDAEFISTAYEVYASSVAEVWSNGRLTATGERRFAWYKQLLGEMEALLGRKGRLLEIGCHTGFFCKVARDLGWTVTGVDISPTMIELARREFGLDVRCGNWLDMSFDTPFDFVYCSHTVEHVPNPEDWMARFRDILAPGGKLCLEVPNMESIDRKFKRVLKRAGLRKDSWEPWRTPDHLFEPCERSLIPFVERCQFKVLKILTYSRSKSGEGFLAKLFHEKWRAGTNLRLFLEPTRS
jgi:2-polyprenyl-3-methyl-5-hydroxy-6-metoxy-1,4-benzoquinol methylase